MVITAFLDSDILFRYFAISPEKKSRFYSEGTTGLVDLDKTFLTIQKLHNKPSTVHISEFSILELICILSRLGSSFKIPGILKSISQSMIVTPLTDEIVTLACALATIFKFHTGDSLHSAFCILNNIEEVFISDAQFFREFSELKKTYRKEGNENFSRKLREVPLLKEIADGVFEKLQSLVDIQISSV